MPYNVLREKLGFRVIVHATNTQNYRFCRSAEVFVAVIPILVRPRAASICTTALIDPAK